MKEGIQVGPFFPRGPGPLVSILLCSRGRVGHLLRALDSLVSLAADPGNLEVLLKLDDDDVSTVEAVRRVREFMPQLALREFVTPRGNGFADMHHWVNMLLGHARGDWVIMFNDDAMMKTQDWDLALAGCSLSECWHSCPEDVWVMTAEVNGRGDSNEFPIVRRRLMDMLVPFTTPYIDSWLVRVAEMLDCKNGYGAVKIEHLRDVVRDRTREETDGLYHENIHTLISAGAIAAKIADASKVLSHILRRGCGEVETAAPDGDGWYHWRTSPSLRPSFVYVRGGEVVYPANGQYASLPLEGVGGIWVRRSAGPYQGVLVEGPAV